MSSDTGQQWKIQIGQPSKRTLSSVYSHTREGCVLPAASVVTCGEGGNHLGHHLPDGSQTRSHHLHCHLFSSTHIYLDWQPTSQYRRQCQCWEGLTSECVFSSPTDCNCSDSWGLMKKLCCLIAQATICAKYHSKDLHCKVLGGSLCCVFSQRESWQGLCLSWQGCIMDGGVLPSARHGQAFLLMPMSIQMVCLQQQQRVFAFAKRSLLSFLMWINHFAHIGGQRTRVVIVRCKCLKRLTKLNCISLVCYQWNMDMTR